MKKDSILVDRIFSKFQKIEENSKVTDTFIIRLSERIAILEGQQESNFKTMLDTLSNRLKDWIEQETRNQLSDEGLRLKIKKMTESMIDKDFIRQLSEKIAKIIIGNLGSSLNYELKNIKSVAYSIETEIKHIYRDLPMGHSDSEKIVNRIKEAIDKQVALVLKQELKQLEVKK